MTKIKIRRGTRKAGEHGNIFIGCPHCRKETKLNAEEVQDIIMRLEDSFDNL